jgi:precorrin isomerase
MMVVNGITRKRLPKSNSILCLIHDPQTAERARVKGTTRAAAAVDEWRPWLEGAVVAIGNAPTALFRLIEIIEGGGPKPALIIGVPVGFVGAEESKLALASTNLDVPFITVHGRRGGSAMAAAALNALTSEEE